MVRALSLSGTPIEFAFIEESGKWKVDPGALLDSATVALEESAAKKGITVDQVITETLTAQFGADRGAQLRKPIDS